MNSPKYYILSPLDKNNDRNRSYLYREVKDGFVSICISYKGQVQKMKSEYFKDELNNPKLFREIDLSEIVLRCGFLPE